MSFTVTMPQLGETVTEGTILRWVKQVGDAVAEDDVLLEISTDKVDTEVPSPFVGTLLEILVAAGETVDVGTVLAVIGEPGEAAGETAVPVAAEPVVVAPAPVAAEPVTAASASVAAVPLPPSAPPADAAVSEPVLPPPVAPPPLPPVTAEAAAASAVSAGVSRGILSPVVRRLAAEYGIDLSAVTGSGRGGRITRRDVEFAAGELEAPPAIASGDTSAGGVRRAGLGRGIDDLMADAAQPPSGIVAASADLAGTDAVVATGPGPAVVGAPGSGEGVGAEASEAGVGNSTVEPIGRLRGRIATNLVRAKRTAAHVWTSMEVDYEQVERVRRRHKAAFKEREGMSLTYLPFISRATIDALAAFPVVNSSFDLEAGTRTFHSQVDLGFGVDLDQEGLVVMTMRGADGLRLRGIAREVKHLADKARGGGMEPDDLTGSTFTITNPGPYGSFMSAPIINLPNVAILSTDGIKKRPVAISDSDGNDALAIHHTGYLGLTWDHRAFDGSTAVLFLGRIKQNLETWDWEQELA